MHLKERTRATAPTQRGGGATNVRWWRCSLLVGALWLVSLHAAAQTCAPKDIAVSSWAPLGQAYAVSDNGTVVGTYSGSVYGTGTIATHGFVWSADGNLNDPFTLGGTNTYLRGVNKAGQVVGSSDITGNGATHALLWTAASGMVDIGTLGGSSSAAYGINNGGEVVGASAITGTVATHAFLWTPGSGMLDLGTLGGSDSWAYGVNDAGEVVGESTLASGLRHAFFVTRS
jgi:probable HAF family extracellular repeat protein